MRYNFYAEYFIARKNFSINICYANCYAKFFKAKRLSIKKKKIFFLIKKTAFRFCLDSLYYPLLHYFDPDLIVWRRLFVGRWMSKWLGMQDRTRGHFRKMLSKSEKRYVSLSFSHLTFSQNKYFFALFSIRAVSGLASVCLSEISLGLGISVITMLARYVIVLKVESRLRIWYNTASFINTLFFKIEKYFINGINNNLTFP